MSQSMIFSIIKPKVNLSTRNSDPGLDAVHKHLKRLHHPLNTFQNEVVSTEWRGLTAKCLRCLWCNKQTPVTAGRFGQQRAQNSHRQTDGRVTGFKINTGTMVRCCEILLKDPITDTIHSVNIPMYSGGIFISEFQEVTQLDQHWLKQNVVEK